MFVRKSAAIPATAYGRRSARNTVPAFALIGSGLTRAVGEVAEIANGGPSQLSGALAVVALVCFATGLVGVLADGRHRLTARVAFIATLLGIIGLIAIATYSIFNGTPRVATLARDLPFVLSAIATLVGIAALAVWLIRTPDYPRWLGPTLLLSVAGSIAASFLTLPPITQPLLDILMAATFFQFGLSMDAHRLPTAEPAERS